MKKTKSGARKGGWIEQVNSYGPFTHSPWKGAGVRVSNEENLEGRADFLVSELRRIIKANFTSAQIKKMTIADVGCYDGWILHQLSDLPFKKMIGFEPRRKNIIKGHGIRKLLDISTRVQFRARNIDSLGKEKFDIVLCIGVFHHLESIAHAVRNLDKITKRMLVVDTICLPEKYLTKSLENDLELKDVIYQKKPKQFGLTGEKYESAYYDGSASRAMVVSIPSVPSIIMNLDVAGYHKINVSAGPEKFRRAMKKNKRPFEEVLLYGLKTGETPSDKETERYIWQYEYDLIHHKLDSSLIESLYNHYINGAKTVASVAPVVIAYIDAGQGDTTFLKSSFRKPVEFEIVKNMSFNPKDKIKFEYAKLLYSREKHQEALDVLESITQTLNADWRAVYRSFYLMHIIYQRLGNKKQSAHYALLCKRCHANFPLL